MVERQARDLEVRVRIPVQVQIFLLTFMKYFIVGALDDKESSHLKG